MWISLARCTVILIGLTLISPHVSYAQQEVSANNAAEQDFKIRFPARCEYGVDCWLLNTPDTNPANEKNSDSVCGPRSYDGHKGVDFAIRDTVEMEKGVDVVSVAKGKVLRFRDGEEDAFRGEQAKTALNDANRNCGNGVIIDHENGWLSQYCHLKNGSIVVDNGQNVMPSQKIAEIGLSGISDHPHIHLTLIRKGKIIDPFTGADTEGACEGNVSGALWEDPKITYEPIALYDGGFATEIPDFELISAGTRGELPRIDSEALLFWIAYFGAREGDKIAIEITDPDNKVFVSDVLTQDKTRARQFYTIGKKAPSSGFKKGTWKGTVTVTRPGTDIQESLTRAVDVF